MHSSRIFQAQCKTEDSRWIWRTDGDMVINTMTASGWLENGVPFCSQSGQVFSGSWGLLVGISTGRGGQMSSHRWARKQGIKLPSNERSSASGMGLNWFFPYRQGFWEVPGSNGSACVWKHRGLKWIVKGLRPWQKDAWVQRGRKARYNLLTIWAYFCQFFITSVTEQGYKFRIQLCNKIIIIPASGNCLFCNCFFC